MTGWLILAYVVTLVGAMAGSFALAIRLSRSTIQASKDLAETALEQVDLSSRLARLETNQELTHSLLGEMKNVVGALDLNVGEMANRLSDGGHLRVTQPPKGIGPRGQWGGGDEGIGHSGTPA